MATRTTIDPRAGGRILGALLALAVLVASCSSDTDSTESGDVSIQDGETEATADESGPDAASDEQDDAGASDDTDTEAEADDTASPPRPENGPPAVIADAPLLASGRVVPADLDGPSVGLTTIREEPYIGAAVYPRPDYQGNPWSQWGQGTALADGRVITAIGDHLGADGNSYLYVYDPDQATLTRFADVLSALDHEPGSWGYGKVHGQMVDGGDGGIYFSTYWGTRRGLTIDGSYEGDVLFRLDGDTLDLQPVVVPVPGFGIPSLASDGQGHIYGEAVDPALDRASFPGGGFFVYDVASGTVSTFAPDPSHSGFRNVMVTPDGSAYFAGANGGLFAYDPSSESIATTDIRLTSDLRASTIAASDGTIYGVTNRPTFELFSFGADRAVETLGNVDFYTTSLALLPDESGFVYVPGAHGQSASIGAPLIAVDAATGEQTTIVELADLVGEELGLTLGGTYSVTVDPARSLAHIGFNAGPAGDPWGEVVFVVVELT